MSELVSDRFLHPNKIRVKSSIVTAVDINQNPVIRIFYADFAGTIPLYRWEYSYDNMSTPDHPDVITSRYINGNWESDAPFLSDLNIWLDVLTGLVWTDTINGLDAEIIPVIGLMNGGDDYLAGAHLVGSETVISSIGTSTPSISAGRIDFTAGTIAELVLSNGDKLVFCEGLNSEYVYNVVNDDHYTWNGTGNHYTYDAIGSTHAKDLGLDIWADVLKNKIRVPYDINRVALVAPPVPVGYVLQSEHRAILGSLNMPDCLIDYDPNDTLDARLENFDRSNETIYNVLARAADYDAGNTYRFHIDLMDPRRLFQLLNVGYKGKPFARIQLDADKNLIRIREVISYQTDKLDELENEVMNYCGFFNIIIVAENGDFIIDDDFYVIIENL